MTEVLSRMLNDPMTRAALSAGGEDALNSENPQGNSQEASENAANVARTSEPMDTETEEG